VEAVPTFLADTAVKPCEGGAVGVGGLATFGEIGLLARGHGSTSVLFALTLVGFFGQLRHRRSSHRELAVLAEPSRSSCTSGPDGRRLHPDLRSPVETRPATSG
jgi:hypothetical protein